MGQRTQTGLRISHQTNVAPFPGAMIKAPHLDQSWGCGATGIQGGMAWAPGPHSAEHSTRRDGSNSREAAARRRDEVRLPSLVRWATPASPCSPLVVCVVWLEGKGERSTPDGITGVVHTLSPVRSHSFGADRPGGEARASGVTCGQREPSRQHLT